MIEQKSTGRTLFLIFNYLFLGISAFFCLLPLINVFSISLSSSSAVTAGLVKLWPVKFTLDAYKFVLTQEEFGRAFFVAIERVALGYVVNILMSILVAFPLSKSKQHFSWRNMYSWFFVVTMLFYGGLIPFYMTVRSLGLLDSIWALVLPGAVPVFNMIILMNFFRGLPMELEEAAFIDGAGAWTSLFRIYLPLSKPSIATISLFIMVFHWNSWFDGLILMNRPENYPLQSYLQTIVISADLSKMGSQDFRLLQNISDRNFKAAQIFLAAFPILAVYPFLQRYFMKGLIVGSVKG